MREGARKGEITANRNVGDALPEREEERPEGERGWLSRQRTHSMCKGPVVSELGAFGELEEAQRRVQQDLTTESRRLYASTRSEM